MTFDLGIHKSRGAFFTPAEITRFLVNWAVRKSVDSVLEPSCGDAAFLSAAAERLMALGATRAETSRSLVGVEIHAPSVAEAERRLAREGLSATITSGDFFDQSPQRQFDVVVGNPPFIRYQRFAGTARANSLRAALASGVRLTSLASSWAAFAIHASEFLKDDGRLGLVLPAELLSVNYAAEVRRFLLNRFTKVRLVLFENLVFPGVAEEVVLLLAEGRGKSINFEVYQAQDAASLKSLDTSSWQDFTPADDEKWTPALISIDALATYREITHGNGFSKLIEWGETYLGSVTGNNEYFTMTAATVDRLNLDLSEVLKISPPGARHLRGLMFTSKAWNNLAEEGARCYLFAPQPDRPSLAARAYITAGEKAGIHKAYKCRTRSPWWRVPLVARPDLLFTYMNHERPRLTTNDAGALVLNSLYGVRLRPGVRKLGQTSLPLASLNTVTLLGSEVVGRAYGGGLLKHEPREADLLPVPSVSLIMAVGEELHSLSPEVSAAMSENRLLRAVELVDSIILERHLRLERSQISQLRKAREALFNRRMSRGRIGRGEN
ncbi:MAG: SAM-dependent DNA methyltransferase [Methylobacteriaceae bacterium]|nr:SAM-dependent DNA methyltransferase [Methylobacteriaceae bacterium]